METIRATELVGSVISALGKYDSNWRVVSIGTSCGLVVNNMKNPYVVTLAHVLTGEQATEYIPYWR